MIVAAEVVYVPENSPVSLSIPQALDHQEEGLWLA